MNIACTREDDLWWDIPTQLRMLIPTGFQLLVIMQWITVALCASNVHVGVVMKPEVRFVFVHVFAPWHYTCSYEM